MLRLAKLVSDKVRPSQNDEELEGSTYPPIEINDMEANQEQDFPSNMLRTTKYRAWNFIFKNLFEQFQRTTNVYFLLSCSCLLL